MTNVSKEQIAVAREIDLLSYLQTYEPHELKADGSGRFTTVTHDSLVISRGKWMWNSAGVGGKSALDYLVKVRGMGFVDAVKMLTNSHGGAISAPTPKAQSPPEKRKFYPPKPLRYSNGAVAYLQKRGIAPEIIARCMELGTVFESRYYNPESPYHNCAVCIFAGKDENGEIRFAAMRGIDSDLKQDKAGSDKRFNFCLPAKSDSHTLAVFEAPVDLLSHATMFDTDCNRLSLGGTSPVALTSYLNRNLSITNIELCLDNDTAGHKAVKLITEQLKNDERFRLSIDDSTNSQKKGKGNPFQAESTSIENQRDILTQYVQLRGWNLTKVYADDGYAGGSFNRPAFLEMVQDAELGLIDLILVKDLSRLGRDYIEVGRYTDDVFPTLGVRFIALMDGIDSVFRFNITDNKVIDGKAKIIGYYEKVNNPTEALQKRLRENGMSLKLQDRLFKR